MVLTCEKASSLLYMYSADALSSRQASWVRAHLEGCEECRKQLARVEAITESLRQTDTPRAPVGMAAHIKAEARLREAHRKANGVPARVIGSPAFLAVCSSLIAGAIITFTILTQVILPGIPTNIDEPLPPPPTMVAALSSGATALGGTVVGLKRSNLRTVPVAGSPVQHLRLTNIPARIAPTSTTAPVARMSAPRAVNVSLRERPRAIATPSIARDTSGRDFAATDPCPPGGVGVRSATPRTSTLGAEMAPEAPNPDVRAAALTGEIVGALVAGLVVDRYVRDSLARKETTLLSVTTSAPSTVGGTLLTGGPTKDQ